MDDDDGSRVGDLEAHRRRQAGLPGNGTPGPEDEFDLTSRASARPMLPLVGAPPTGTAHTASAILDGPEWNRRAAAAAQLRRAPTRDRAARLAAARAVIRRPRLGFAAITALVVIGAAAADLAGAVPSGVPLIGSPPAYHAVDRAALAARRGGATVLPERVFSQAGSQAAAVAALALRRGVASVRRAAATKSHSRSHARPRVHASAARVSPSHAATSGPLQPAASTTPEQVASSAGSSSSTPQQSAGNSQPTRPSTSGGLVCVSNCGVIR